MREKRNRLLITLVLFGVLSAAAAHAQTSLVRFGKAPTSPLGYSAYQPGATPTAGEPDVGQGGPTRLSMTPTTPRLETTTTTTAQTRMFVPFATTLRWAWVIWMARYLNLPL